MFELWITLVCISIIFVTGYQKNWKKRLLPPGPPGFPFLGNMLQILPEPHLIFSQWAKTYGDLYTIYLAHKPTLIISDRNLMNELFAKMPATGRFKSELILMATQGNSGIGTAEGSAWLEHRQFCLRTLKDLGVYREERKQAILREIEDLCVEINNEQVTSGKVCLNEKLILSIGNTFHHMIVGETILHKSNIWQSLQEWHKYFQITTNSGVIFFSWLKYLAPVRSGYEGYKRACDKINAYVRNTFHGHFETKTNGEPRDMVDAIIAKVQSCKNPQSTFYGENGLKSSMASIAGILLAADTSTAALINWIIYYLSVHPQIQTELQKEIQSVVGDNRDPQYGDKAKMPLMEGVILEALRYSSIAPFGTVHELLDDIFFHGYNLPKGMLLIPNIYYVHNDKRIWGDPEIFRPRRFLEDCSHLKESVIAFAVGKRSCPGEGFTKDATFLFATKLFQRFRFSVDPSVENPLLYLEPNIGYGLQPKKLSVICTLRE